MNPGCTINILADLDMNGQGGKNYTNIGEMTNVTIKGNNHTIYNYQCDRGTQECAGICTKFSSGSSLSDLTFVSSYLRANKYIGIIAWMNAQTAVVKIQNVHVRDALHASTTSDGGEVGCVFGTTSYYRGDRALSADQRDISLINCGSENCTTIGYNHVGGTFGLYDWAYFDTCYAQNDTVISFGGHSGPLASCSNTYATFINCWSNSTIYGKSIVGGFTSGVDGRGALYKNCFSSGIVEGNNTLGGFVAITGTRYANNGKYIVYENCYTTCMVGMNYQGTNLGGFCGEAAAADFANCYAAGEVGSIDTKADTTDSCGGFIGFLGDLPGIGDHDQYGPWRGCNFTNCYYDMQSTAMKNRSIGTEPLVSMSRTTDGGVSTSTYKGITGLTTRKITGSQASGLFSSGYVCKSGLYPQLSVMASHDNVLFRAQSAASATAVYCDEWANISQAGFDTVRDTMRNYAFSSIEDYGANTQFSAAQVDEPAITSLTWSADGNISPIDKKTPVMQLNEQPYYTTATSPGIEWVNAALVYKDSKTGRTASGTRRLRLIPTSVIDTNGDKRIDVFYDDDENNETESYDHKEGFATTYLDASTLLSYIESDETHTEALLTFEQVANQQYDKGTITGTIELPFNSENKNLTVTATLLGKDGAQAVIENFYEKMNGRAPFATEDCGIYRIVYRSALADGRYLSIGKKLVIVGPWSVVYNYNYDGLLGDDRIHTDSIFHIQSNLVDFSDYTFADYEEPPDRAGWTFAYWSLDSEGRQPVDQSWFDSYADNYGVLNKNIDVYAQYNRQIPPLHSLTIDPTIGSYDGQDIGETITISGGTGDRVIIAIPAPPKYWTFSKWKITGENGGSLEYSDDTGLWVFTFGDGNAIVQAKYDQKVFSATIRKLRKQSRTELCDPVAMSCGAGEMIEIDAAEGIDSTLYVAKKATVEIFDADTGESLAPEEVGWTKAINKSNEPSGDTSDNGTSNNSSNNDNRGNMNTKFKETSFYLSMPERNLEIVLLYDTYVQVPETGIRIFDNFNTLITIFGAITVLAGLCAISFRKIGRID